VAATNEGSCMVVTLTDDDITRHAHIRLQDRFAQVFVAAGAPMDAVMFGNRGPGTKGHRFYFSRKAAGMLPLTLHEWSPVSCEAPARETVSLLVGNGGPWQMLPSDGSAPD
jgi:hypothetical protein